MGRKLRLILRDIRDRVKAFLRWNSNQVVTYSQEGEDLILRRIFSDVHDGFYIDIGAHHPFRFSNTAWAHEKGWTGINLDATPGSMKEFERVRPEDINLEVAVSANPGFLDLATFPEPALNTTVKERLEQVSRETGSVNIFHQVRAMPLSAILEAHFNADLPQVDLMSIDIEGSELLALESNNWELCQPRVIVVELLGANVMTVADHPVSRFLFDHDYVLVSFLYHSGVFVSDRELLGTHWP